MRLQSYLAGTWQSGEGRATSFAMRAPVRPLPKP
jgi:hypothetical protein